MVNNLNEKKKNPDCNFVGV